MSDLHSAASALVAFPVSIQPSSVGSSTSGTGNIILQAQNMGQPFLLTPNYDPSRQSSLLNSQASSSFTPPSTLAGLSPSRKDLEQLKHQYEKVHQQILQQQLFLSQTLQQQAKDGATTGSTVQVRVASMRRIHETGLGTGNIQPLHLRAVIVQLFPVQSVWAGSIALVPRPLPASHCLQYS